MVILIPFLLVAIIFILFIFCMVFVACYWRRHELKLQKLGRDTSTPVAPVVVVDNVPAGHAGMVQTGYYPAHLNASGPDLSSVSRLQPTAFAISFIYGSPIDSRQSTRNTRSLHTQAMVIPTQDHYSLLSEWILLHTQRNNRSLQVYVMHHVHDQLQLTKSPLTY